MAVVVGGLWGGCQVSYVIALPELLEAAAADMARIGSSIGAAHAAAAGPTTGILAAAADEVSTAIASLFSAHGKSFHGIGTRAAEFHAQFVQALKSAGGAYAAADTANASPMQAVAHGAQSLVFSPVKDLTGRPLVGDDGLLLRTGGANGSNSTAAASATSSTTGQNPVATIPVGQEPRAMVVSPDGRYLYVANYASNLTSGSVSVINISTNTTVADIPVGVHPDQIVVAPDGSHVYVSGNTNLTDGINGVNAVVGINTATYTASQPIQVSTPYGTSGAAAMGITPDGSRLYVADGPDSTVTVINTTTNTTVGNPISVSGASHLAVTPDGKSVYVTGSDSGGTVSVIDTATNTVTATVSDPLSPGLLTLSPDGSRLYVQNGDGASITVIDTTTNAAVGDPISFTTTGNNGNLAISPDGRYLYVPESTSPGFIKVVDTQTDAVTSIPFENYAVPSNVAFSPDGHYAYVTATVQPGSQVNSALVVINTTNNTISDPITLGNGTDTNSYMWSPRTDWPTSPTCSPTPCR